MSASPGALGSERVRLREGAVAWRLVEDEVVALDLVRSTYLGVNRTGAVLWSALASGATRAELLDLVTTSFDVDPARAAEDVEAFLAGLARRGLIEGVETP